MQHRRTEMQAWQCLKEWTGCKDMGDGKAWSAEREQAVGVMRKGSLTVTGCMRALGRVYERKKTIQLMRYGW